MCENIHFNATYTNKKQSKTFIFKLKTPTADK